MHQHIVFIINNEITSYKWIPLIYDRKNHIIITMVFRHSQSNYYTSDALNYTLLYYNIIIILL